jgi:PelA/Pel-15E family pectate lyase
MRYLVNISWHLILLINCNFSFFNDNDHQKPLPFVDGWERAKTLVVAQDGSGNFKSIQEAINSLPEKSDNQRVIFIKKGIYQEKIYIEKNKITLKGENQNLVKISISEAREIWRCNYPDDWGVATLNLKASDITLENLTINNEYGFLVNEDSAIICPQESGNQKVVKRISHQMALRALPGTTRLTVKNCTFRSLGGDTVSPWDTDNGMYYFQNCTMEGDVDFYCPRGWAYAENCTFICHNKSAAIWHDGTSHKNSKTVLKNCTFQGDDGFKLGRYHREAQFYLIDCQFPSNMADAPIYWVNTAPNPVLWGERIYYYNCHRQGGDYAWHQNNLPKPLAIKEIDAFWTFDGKWNPANTKQKNLKVNLLKKDAKKALPMDSLAENMLIYQRKVGGWAKHNKEGKPVNYSQILPASEKANILADSLALDATIDNQATTKEIRHLLTSYHKTYNPNYLKAVKKGINYLLKAQMENGGWAQFYPDTSDYRKHITFNDNAMINVLYLLKDIVEQKNGFEIIEIEIQDQARQALAKGIDCILKTQNIVQGKRTVWCAQHHYKTLEPVKARAYELPSNSGSESAKILLFLMSIPQPTQAIREAVKAGLAWFETSQIKDYQVVTIDDSSQAKGKDKVLIPDEKSMIWARFYDLESNEPFVVGRAGVKKKNLAEIEYERRMGYAYYGTWGKAVLDQYPLWLKKWNIIN